MRKTVREIAELLGGTVEGDGSIVIRGVAGIREAGEGEISFLSQTRYESLARETRASALLVRKDWTGECPATLIRVDNPSEAFSTVVGWVSPEEVSFEPGVHETAVVAEDVELGADVSIQPNAVVEPGARIGDRTVIGAGSYVGRETSIGEDCLIHPLVVVRERVRLGDRVILHSGTVIGSDGFGYETVDGRHRKIPQVGSVRIDDDVEIGANVTVDRARFGTTWIRAGTKIDNLVQIAHNVVIGEHSIIVAQVGISGSTEIGAHATLAGQSGVAGHLRIGDGVVVAARSGVTKDIPPGKVVFGFPATDQEKGRRIMACTRRLPALYEKVRLLEKELAELKRRIPS